MKNLTNTSIESEIIDPNEEEQCLNEQCQYYLDLWQLANNDNLTLYARHFARRELIKSLDLISQLIKSPPASKVKLISALTHLYLDLQAIRQRQQAAGITDETQWTDEFNCPRWFWSLIWPNF